jgi:hypothetical protein
MRKFLLIGCVLLCQLTFGQSDSIYLSPNHIDLGDIRQGEIKKFEFLLVNHSLQTVNLDDAGVTCGCTVPEWSSDPVYSKDELLVKAKFDSSNKEGFLRKKIILVLSNGERRAFSFIINVLPKE